MSAEAEVSHESIRRWCKGIPPLDPTDLRHSLSLLLFAEAREGQQSPKKPTDTTFPKKNHRKGQANH